MNKATSILIILISLLVFSGCEKKDKVNLPDLSGRYTCSFTIYETGMRAYSANGTFDFVKSTSNDYTYYAQNATGIFRGASLIVQSETHVQFNLSQQNFVHDGQQRYVTMWVQLINNNYTFTPNNGQIVFGTVGVSSKTLDPKATNFSLNKLN